MLWVAPKEKGAMPEEIPNPDAQSKLMAVMVSPPPLTFVMVNTLAPDAIPTYVFGNTRELGVEVMSVVCANADRVANPSSTMQLAARERFRRVAHFIIQPPLSTTHFRETSACQARLETGNSWAVKPPYRHVKVLFSTGLWGGVPGRVRSLGSLQVILDLADHPVKDESSCIPDSCEERKKRKINR